MDDLRAHGAARAQALLQQLDNLSEGALTAATPLLRKDYNTDELKKDIAALHEYVNELELRLMTSSTFTL